MAHTSVATAAAAWKKGRFPVSDDPLLLQEEVARNPYMDAPRSKETATRETYASGKVCTLLPQRPSTIVEPSIADLITFQFVLRGGTN